MNNYRDNRSGGGMSGGGRYGGGGFRGRDSGRREMYDAVCDACGKNCKVPFRPSGDKPVYCSDCFEQQDGGSSNRQNRRGSVGSGFEDRDNTNKQLLEQVKLLNVKIDKIVRIIEFYEGKKQVENKIEAGSKVKGAVSKKEKVEAEKVVKAIETKDEEVKAKKESKKETKKSETEE